MGSEAASIIAVIDLQVHDGLTEGLARASAQTNAYADVVAKANERMTASANAASAAAARQADASKVLADAQMRVGETSRIAAAQSRQMSLANDAGAVSAGNAMRAHETHVRTVLNGAKSLGTLGIFAGAPGVAIGAAGIYEWAHFNDLMQTIQGNTLLSATQMARLRSETLDLASKGPQSIDSIAQGLMHLANIGFHGADAMNIETEAWKAAIATGGQTSDMANLLGTSLHLFKAPAGDATRYMNQLVQAAASGNVTLPDLTNNMSKASAISAVAGLSFGETVSTLSALTRSFHSASLAQTGMVNILTHLEHVSSTSTKELLTLPQGQGVLDNITAFQNGLISFTQVMQDIKNSNLPASTLMSLFGGVRGGAAAASMFQNWNDYLSIRQKVLAANDQITASFKKMMTEPAVRAETDLNKVKVALVHVGDDLAPAVAQVLGDLTPLIDGFSSLAKQNPVLVSGFVLGSAALLGFGVALRGVVGPAEDLVKVYKGFRELEIGSKIARLLGGVGSAASIATTGATAQLGAQQAINAALSEQIGLLQAAIVETRGLSAAQSSGFILGPEGQILSSPATRAAAAIVPAEAAGAGVVEAEGVAALGGLSAGAIAGMVAGVAAAVSIPVIEVLRQAGIIKGSTPVVGGISSLLTGPSNLTVPDWKGLATPADLHALLKRQNTLWQSAMADQVTAEVMSGVKPTQPNQALQTLDRRVNVARQEIKFRPAAGFVTETGGMVLEARKSYDDIAAHYHSLEDRLVQESIQGGSKSHQAWIQWKLGTLEEARQAADGVIKHAKLMAQQAAISTEVLRNKDVQNMTDRLRQMEVRANETKDRVVKAADETQIQSLQHSLKLKEGDVKASLERATSVVNSAKNEKDGVERALKDLGVSIPAAMKALSSSVITDWNDMRSKTATSASQMASDAEKQVSQMSSTVEATMASLAGQTASYGQAAGANYAAGLASEVGAVSQAADALNAAAQSHLKGHSPPPGAPWADFEDWGHRAGNLYARGVLASVGAVARSSDDLNMSAEKYLNQAIAGAQAGTSHITLTSAMHQLRHEGRSADRLVSGLPDSAMRQALEPTLRKIAFSVESATTRFHNSVEKANESLNDRLHAISVSNSKNKAAEILAADNAHVAALKSAREHYALLVEKQDQALHSLTNLDLSAQTVATTLSTEVTNRTDALGIVLDEGRRHIAKFVDAAADATRSQMRYSLAEQRAAEMAGQQAGDWTTMWNSLTGFTNAKMTSAVDLVASQIYKFGHASESAMESLYRLGIEQNRQAAAAAQAQSIVQGLTNGMQGYQDQIARAQTNSDFTFYNNLMKARGMPTMAGVGGEYMPSHHHGHRTVTELQHLRGEVRTLTSELVTLRHIEQNHYQTSEAMLLVQRRIEGIEGQLRHDDAAIAAAGH